MKRNLLFSVVLAMLPMLASAQSLFHEEPNGVYYRCYDNSWYEGVEREAYVVDYLKHDDTGTVIIPETITENGNVYTVTIMDENAMEKGKFSAIVIPDGVRRIEEDAFKGCTNLAAVYIGKNIEYIGEDAFSGCEALRDLTILALDPPAVGDNPIAARLLDLITLHVPTAAIDNYRHDPFYPFWCRFKAYDDVVNIPTAIENVTNSPTTENRQSFDLLGRQLTQQQKGLNIIREANGNTKKMIIR